MTLRFWSVGLGISNIKSMVIMHGDEVFPPMNDTNCTDVGTVASLHVSEGKVTWKQHHKVMRHSFYVTNTNSSRC